MSNVGLNPVDDNILVQRIAPPGTKKSRIINPVDDEVSKSPWVTVIAAGPKAFIHQTDPAIEEPVATPVLPQTGDVLLVKYFGGTELMLGSIAAIFIKPEHVLAVFQKAEQSS